MIWISFYSSGLLKTKVKLNVEPKNCLVKENSRYNALSEFVCVIKWWRVRAQEIITIWTNTGEIILFLNFISIPFDYLLISWVMNYVSTQARIFDMFILDHNYWLTLSLSAWLKLKIFRIFRQNTCKNPSWCALLCA